MPELQDDITKSPLEKKISRRRSLVVVAPENKPETPPTVIAPHSAPTPTRRSQSEAIERSVDHQIPPLKTDSGNSVEYKDDDSVSSSQKKRIDPITYKPRINSYIEFQAANLMLSDSEDEDEEHHLVKKLPFVLLPSSPIRIGWDLFILLLLAFILITTPLELAFSEIAEKFDTTALVIDSIFLFDVVINFITAYRPREDEELVEARLHKIAWRYLSSWFVLDVASCPSILLLLLTLKGLPSEFSLLKLLKGAKTLKMLKMVKVLKVLRVSKLMGNYALELEELMMRGSVQVRVKLIQLGCVVALSAHFLACFWIAVSKTSPDQTSWMFSYRDGDLDDAPYFNEWSMSEQYITAFYFAIMTMTTVGFGDIVPSSTSERLYMIAAMVVGGGMYGFIIASLASVVTSLDMNQKQYFTKMDTIHSYMSYRKFPAQLRHRVHRYFRKFYEVNSALDEKAILNDLPDTLRTEVMKLIVNESVTVNYLFRSLPDEAVTRLASLFKPAEVDERTDYIIKRGEPGAMMFIITSGVAEFTGAVNDSIHSSFMENREGVLEAGDCFGELVALGIEDCYNLTVTAWDHTPLEVLVASREDMLNTFSDEVMTVLRKRAFEHTVAPRKHMMKKKPKNVVGENGSGVGPFNLVQFMKFEPPKLNFREDSQERPNKSILGTFSSLNFLKQSTVSGRSAFFERGAPVTDYYPNSSYHSRHDSESEIVKSFDPSPKRRATTGSALFASETMASISEGDGSNAPPQGNPVRRSISHASIVSSKIHSLGHDESYRRQSSLYHTAPPAPLSPAPLSPTHPHHPHHHLHHRAKHTGSTTRGGGGEMLPKGFSDDVFELLEQVLDEVALVNQRLTHNEESIKTLRKFGEKRTSSASKLFNHLKPIEPDHGKLPALTNPPSVSPVSSVDDCNQSVTPNSMPGTKVSFSMRMKVDANWMPLHSYQHPYFRILRPGPHVFKPMLTRNITNELPVSCVVYESEVTMRCASPSWKAFSVVIDNLHASEGMRWQESIILECWDWSRDRAHALIGTHYTTLGMLRDVKEGTAPVRTVDHRPGSPLLPQDFILHRGGEDLEIGRLFISPCSE